MSQLPSTILDKRITEIDWHAGKNGTARIINALCEEHFLATGRYGEIPTIGDVMQLGLSRHYLIRTPNLGQKSVEAIILALSELGLQIEGPKPSPVRPDVAANA